MKKIYYSFKKNHIIFLPLIVYVLPNCNSNISISMYINSIASIWRGVLGLARHEDVPACHEPCLDLIIDLSCQHGTARHDVRTVPEI